MKVELPRHARIVEALVHPSGDVVLKVTPRHHYESAQGPQTRVFTYVPASEALTTDAWTRLLARFNISGREGEFLLYELNCPIREDRKTGDLIPASAEKPQ